MPISKNVNRTIVIAGMLSVLLAGFLAFSSDSMAAMPEQVKAFYLPSHSFTERKISEYIHYAELAGLNAAVLHVKDPHGWIRWKSNNPLAREDEAIAVNGLVEPALKRLKALGFWMHWPGDSIKLFPNRAFIHRSQK